MAKFTRTGYFFGFHVETPRTMVPKRAEMPRAPSDMINHPPHYTAHKSGVECIEIAEYLGYCLGNAFKYIWRAGLKDSSSRLEDLKKAQWYLDRWTGTRIALAYTPRDLNFKLRRVIEVESPDSLLFVFCRILEARNFKIKRLREAVAKEIGAGNV